MANKMLKSELMLKKDDILALVSGNRRVLGRLLTDVVDFSAGETELLWKTFLRLKKRPKIVGILGTPGAGKSSFLNLFLEKRRSNFSDKKIGLLLIDPSHPITGGALLGDRVRLSEHFLDNDVYIRSVSNQGESEGLSPFLDKYLMLMSLFPFDLIVVEAVGGGQSATSLSEFADQIILIFDPSSGDGIQHLKSGVLDIADEIIISKSDLFQVNPIINSLEEWSNFKGKIWSANFADKKGPDDNFYGRLMESEILDSKKIITAMLKKEMSQKLMSCLGDFSQNYFKKREISEGNVQQFSKNFQKYFCKLS